MSELAALSMAIIGLCYWGVQLVTLVRVTRSVPLLHQLPAEDSEHWPRVSAILTARNEETALEDAVRARLKDDYPSLELIIVEDRSSDETPVIARRLALADSRVKVVHITELPEGWLGKLNALQHGLQAASGEWLLFSDGDVAVHCGVLRRIISYCERRQLDHCVVLPRCRPVHPLLDCLTSLFLRFVVLNFRIWSIEDPQSRASVGVGAFNMVRRTAFERTPGFAWLKMEVADDLCLGQMLKAAGARQSVVNGCAMTELQFHSSLGDSLRSAERATYTAIGNFSLLRLIALATLLLTLELSPLIVLILAHTLLSKTLGLGLLVMALATMVVSNRWLDRQSWNLVFWPLAELLMCYSQLRAGILGTLRGGIFWRGTFYPNVMLKAGRRFGQAWAHLSSAAIAPRSPKRAESSPDAT